MAWTVVESFVESKNDDRVCEDMVVVTPDFAAVIDGASDATGALYGAMTGGRLAAEVVAQAIESLDPTTTARSFADELTRLLTQRVEQEVGELTADTRWPAACVICASFARNEIWRVGDCNFMAGENVNIGGKLVDDAAYSFRAVVNAAMLRSGTTEEEIRRDDPGAAAARPLFDSQQHLSNELGRWGYGCINGRDVPDEFLEVFAIDDEVTELVLASDGYPELRPTLSESEEHLHALLKADPCAVDELWTFGKSLRPGANSIDDRAYLRLRRTVQ